MRECLVLCCETVASKGRARSLGVALGFSFARGGITFSFTLLCNEEIDLVAPDTDIPQEVIVHGMKQSACGTIVALLAQIIQD